ncbi:uncharacterized protein DS421_14g447150 [Arachis hypogaea]|nr:uncharacterized protein DS421_14g447150 [Arachis hypogaea]
MRSLYQKKSMLFFLVQGLISPKKKKIKSRIKCFFFLGSRCPFEIILRVGGYSLNNISC